MRKIKILALILTFVLVFGLTGCYNQPSSEQKTYMEEMKLKYENIATDLVNDSLSEKYGKGVVINEMNVVENVDYVYGFSEEPYEPVATGLAQQGEQIFEYYVRWGINGNNNAFVVCDNKQKAELIEDLDEYFHTLYGVEPYAKYYAVFPSLGYEYDRTDGMMQEYYNGNIEEFISNSGGVINVALAYQNLETIDFEENTQYLETLKNARKVYIFNTKTESMSEDDLSFAIVRGDMDKIVDEDVNEYVRIKIKEYTHWTPENKIEN